MLVALVFGIEILNQLLGMLDIDHRSVTETTFRTVEKVYTITL